MIFHSILDDDEQVLENAYHPIDVMRANQTVYNICVIYYKKLITDILPEDFEKDINWLQTQQSIYKPANNDKLFELVRASTVVMGKECSLNWIDTSEITNMSGLFRNSNFNGDISKWDTSNVTDMHGMFESSLFDGDISEWNVEKVKNISEMFRCSKFSGDIHKWKLTGIDKTDEYSEWYAFACCNIKYTNRPGVRPTVIL